MPSPYVQPRNAPAPAPLDTRTRIETPEGIDLLLRPAGLVPRALAFGIDFSFRALILGGLYLLFSLFESFGAGLTALSLFLVTWWYMVLFEVLNQGCTPGKKIMDLRVIHDDGTPIGWTASLVRNLLRFVDMMPFGYSLGAISCLQHPQFKRLGDLAAGTLVVYRNTPIPRPVLPDAVAVVAPFVMNLEEQRAVLGFAERQRQLSSERTLELASILAEPLQVPPEQAVAQLNGVARGLLGSS
ncbi:RDD family protein [Pseudomonas syringae]|uniref:Membrane protein n=1 Tax=Pseudomonas syringae TaxID=317 RepID=A0A085VP81_PSESX|nr:RDD family protein [Pseudomonas syringae]KFE57244.1 membrane protein [Pseudomonas syringae]